MVPICKQKVDLQITLKLLSKSNSRIRGLDTLKTRTVSTDEAQTSSPTFQVTVDRAKINLTE